MKLAFTEVGTGSRTAALIHGASASSNVWREFAKILADEYDCTVLLPDLRGHGASPRAGSYQVQDFIDDLVENLPSGLDLVIGQSLGALTSMRAAGDLKPRRLVLLDPPLEASPLLAFALARISPFQPLFPDRLVTKLFIPRTAPADTLMRTRANWAAWDRTMMPQIVRSRGGKQHEVTPPEVPTTIVLADPSQFVSDTLAEKLRAAGWDVRVKPGALHDMHVQDAPGLVALLDDVLH